VNETPVRAVVQAALDRIAPGVDLGPVARDEDLRRALDLDSLDFLNLIVDVDERLGLHTAEEDYNRLATIAGCADYLADCPAPQ
jgi:acyl carrier protein